MTFFGMGLWEVLLILIAAMVVFGPDRLPQVAMQLGRAVRDFRRWSADLTREFRDISKEFSAEFEELRSVTHELQAELRGVQADLANEMRGVGEALQGADGSTLALTNGGDPSSQTWAPASAGAVNGHPSNVTSQESTMVSSPPPQASKADPRCDVSVFDLDEIVIMPRTERLVNGHAVALVVEAPDPVAPGPRARRSRPERVLYQRPRPRA